jgi:hypothetical protein
MANGPLSFDMARINNDWQSPPWSESLQLAGVSGCGLAAALLNLSMVDKVNEKLSKEEQVRSARLVLVQDPATPPGVQKAVSGWTALS